MNKFPMTVAAAGLVLAFASPAAAQYAPRQRSYGYRYENNNAARSHQIGLRIERLNRQIQSLGRANVLDARQERSLSLESRALGYRLQAAARNGLDYREQRSIEARLANLEQRVQSVSANGYSNGRAHYRDRNRGHGEGRYDPNRDDRHGARDHD